MPRKPKRTASAIDSLRIQQEREKLLILRMKRKDAAQHRRRPQERDGFDDLSGTLAEATEPETSPRPENLVYPDRHSPS